MANGPGKSNRKGITLLELAEMFPTQESAREWFEGIVWSSGERHCPRCASLNTYECKHVKMPYRCRDCGKYFSVKTGTLMAGSPLPLKTWLYAIYLDCTSLKGVSSMKLHRDLGISQPTAWYMQQRIREAFAHVGPLIFQGPVEVDETFVGGIERNKHNRKKLRAGRGGVGKATVVGARDRATGKVTAQVVDDTTRRTLEGFVLEHTKPGTKVYTDEAAAYDSLQDREAVRHGVGEYVRGMAHTNGIESFWAVFKRAYKGTFHQISAKHLQRYVDEFAGRHNIRSMDTMDQMRHVVAEMVGKRLMYKELIAN